MQGTAAVLILPSPWLDPSSVVNQILASCCLGTRNVFHPTRRKPTGLLLITVLIVLVLVPTAGDSARIKLVSRDETYKNLPDI